MNMHVNEQIEVTEQDKAKNVFAQIEFGPDILDAIIRLHGSGAWNHWVKKACLFYGAFSFPANNEECKPFSVDFNFRNHDFSGRNFSGMNLGMVDMTGAILQRCCLIKSELSMIAHADLRGANLSGATISGVIDGADFTDCIMDDTRFDDPRLTYGEPLPVGLSESVLAFCKKEPKESASEDGENTVCIKVVSAKMVSFWGDCPEPCTLEEYDETEED